MQCMTQELLDVISIPAYAKKPKKPWFSACAERGLSTSEIDHVRACSQGRHIQKSNLLPSQFLVCSTVVCTSLKLFNSLLFIFQLKVPNKFVINS